MIGNDMRQDQGEKLIVGLGKTGLSCARYLHSRGDTFRVLDSRFSPPSLGAFRRQFPDVDIELGGFSRETLLKASEIIISPGISLQTPEIAEAIEHGIPVIGDIDIFSRAVDSPIIAVTGSNGKSTVVTLLGEMASEAGINAGVGGNLDGRASLSALDLLNAGPHDLYVLELSSFQLETTRRLGAEVAVILNISEDHLDRYSSLEEYRRAKQRIFRGCRQILVNREDSRTRPDEPLDVPRWSYGLDEPGEHEFGILEDAGVRHLAFEDRRLMPVGDLRVPGDHNAANALAALALGHAAGMPWAAMLAALRGFRGMPHRCQWLREHQGVAFYNDSKGTNVAATVHAIESVAAAVAGRVVLIAGGIDKGADLTPLESVIGEHVRHLVLIGRDAPRLEAHFEGRTAISRAADMQEAVAIASGAAQSGDAVLLSPACASFDMFQDFAHRGRVFAAAVEDLQ